MRTLRGSGTTRGANNLCNQSGLSKPKSICKGIATAAVLGSVVGSAYLTQPAYADAGNRVKEMSVAKTSSSGNNIPTIRVVSTNGERWDAVEQYSPVGQWLSVKFKVVVRSWASINNVRLMVANCYKDECYSDLEVDAPSVVSPNETPGPHMYYQDLDMGNTKSVSRTIEDVFFPANLPVSSENGVAKWPVLDRLINACNAAGSSPSNGLSLANQTIPVTLVAGTSGRHMATFPGSATYSKTIQYPINVECQRYEESEIPPAPELSFDNGEMTVTDISLKLTARNPSHSASNCETGRVKVKLNTNQAGFASFRLFKKQDGIITQEDVVVGSHHKNGKFVAVHEQTLVVNKTTNFQFRARDLINEPFPHETSWETLKLQCENSGIGGFAEDTTPDNPVNPVPAKWEGDLTIADGNLPQGQYSRPAQLFFAVEAEEAGNFDYHISCSNGRSFQGSVNSFQSGGKWKAFGTHNFSQTRAMMLQCNLREVKANGQKKSLDIAKFLFRSGVNPELPGGVDEVVSPDRDPGRDLPLPKPLTGNFAYLDNSNAAKRNQCDRTAKALVWFDTKKADNVHYSLDCGALGNFPGVLQPASIGDGKYRASKLISFDITETIQAGCTLRTVSPGLPKDHAFKSKTFQCVKSAGHASGVDGVTTGTRNPTLTSTGSASTGIKTAPPKRPSVIANVCKGGKIRYGSCFCPKGSKPVKIGGLKYRCQKDGLASVSKPDIKTAPVRTNPQKPKRVNPTKKKLVCAGGKVRNGKCACGKNKLVRKVSKRKFQCIAVAKPPKKKQALRVNPAPKKEKAKRTNAAKKKVALICKGGKVRNNRCGCPKGYSRKKQGNRKFLCFRPAG